MAMRILACETAQVHKKAAFNTILSTHKNMYTGTQTSTCRFQLNSFYWSRARASDGGALTNGTAETTNIRSLFTIPAVTIHVWTVAGKRSPNYENGQCALFLEPNR